MVIDADDHSTAERRQHLVASLDSSNVRPWSTDEAVAILIPRRNIETWIHYLMGRAVDELTSYPKLKDRQSECQPAIDWLMEWHRSGRQIPDDCPDSLRQAVEELKRIL